MNTAVIKQVSTGLLVLVVEGIRNVRFSLYLPAERIIYVTVVGSAEQPAGSVAQEDLSERLIFHDDRTHGTVTSLSGATERNNRVRCE